MKLLQISDKNELTVVNETSYRDQNIGGFGEESLQNMIADHPELIPSEDIDTSDPPKFIVIQKEAGVTPGSIDILMVDHNAIPTVVETKLVDNREIRRTVLAQGIEYMAHVKTEWDGVRFKEAIDRYYQAQGENYEIVAITRLGVPFDETFISKIDVNISKNIMRLLIVSDEIPSELRRMIEFLNQAADFEVFGVEVKLFAKDAHNKILAPKLIGSSQTNHDKKNAVTGSKWNEERFIQELQKNATPTDMVTVRQLYEFAKEITNRDVDWGTGEERGSFTARFITGKERFSLFSVYTTGDVSINIGWNYLTFERRNVNLSEKYRLLVNNELNISLDKNSWRSGWPMIRLERITPEMIGKLKNIMVGFIREISI